MINFLAVTAKACSGLPGMGNYFFGLPHWWQYMKCVPDGAGGYSPQFNGFSDLFPIALAVINILLRVAGIAAFIAVVMAGVSYIAAVGNPEKITSARKSIQNALLGLAIALIAAQIVAFIGERLS